MKGDKLAKRSSFGSIVRKRLSDITNSLPQQKSSAILEKHSPENASSANEVIDNLTKENQALVKLIQDKNKIIELSGIELQKLRVNLQKMQLQNWNLAQANSHIIAELNIGREKLKSLQHEISCKEALLKANIVNLKEDEIIPADSKANKDGKHNASNRQQRFTRSRSMGSTMSQQAAAKEATENKRRCLRRQSSNFKIQQQQETCESLFEIEDMKLSPDDSETSSCTPMNIDYPVPASPAIVKGVAKQDSGSKCKRAERTSIGGRPLRKAVEKVQSYKEIPLNSKMRRND